MFTTTIIGSLPKLPVDYEAPDNLRRALNAFESRRLGPKDLETVQIRTQERVLGWQKDAGIDLPGDGQTRWQDLLSPLCLDLVGLEVGGLLRFFQNNTYYRHPVVTGRLALEGRSLAGWVREAQSLAGLPLKTSLPGPYTVARLSEDRQYKDFELLLADLAEVLGLLALALEDAGASVVEFEEPALVRETDPGLRRLGLEALRKAAAVPTRPVRVSLYFGDPSAWLPDLAALPLAGVSFDLVEAPGLADRLCSDGFPGRTGLGLLDARDLRPEAPETVLRVADRIASRLGDDLLLHPNTSLEYLPSDGAVRKLHLLGRVSHALKGASR